MKEKIAYIFLFFSVILINNGLPVAGQELEYAGRKWFEWNNTLYRIAAEPESRWKEAHVQCKKEKLQLLKHELMPIEMQYYIRASFFQFPSFWAENNVTDPTFMQKIGFKKGGKGHKCNKIDRKTFALIADDCNKELGFICQTKLHNDTSEFLLKNRKFFIQPASKYYCLEARDECRKRNMTMVPLVPFKSHVLLNDYIFLRYGSKPTFWFAKNNKTNDCLPWTRSGGKPDDVQYGFVCETTFEIPKFTFRHIVLISSVSAVAVLSIIICIVIKCCISRKTAEFQPNIQHEKNPCDCLIQATVICNFI